jgi:hypothetical protein
MTALVLLGAVVALAVVVGRLGWFRPDQGPPVPADATTIASAPTGGTATIEGIVVPLTSERALKTLDGRAVMWWELDVEATMPGQERRDTGPPRPALSLVDTVPFELEDAQGERAHVQPRRGTLIEAGRPTRLMPAMGPAVDRLHDILILHNKAADRRMILMFAERSLAPGDRVIIRGRFQRGTQTPYREAGDLPSQSLIEADEEGLTVWRRG